MHRSLAHLLLALVLALVAGPAAAIVIPIEDFEAGGIRLGAARVRARYRLGGAGHTFTVEQSDGPVPVNLVLDMGLPHAPGRTWIDGTEADVETVPWGTGSRVRVQMPLDRLREIRVERPG